jgi:hypothetical protein
MNYIDSKTFYTKVTSLLHLCCCYCCCFVVVIVVAAAAVAAAAAAVAAAAAAQNNFIHLINHPSIHSSTDCPLCDGFPSPKTKFLHTPLSLLSSSVSPWLVVLHLTPFIHPPFLGSSLPSPSGSHSMHLFPGILFTYPKHRDRFSSIT